MKYKSILLLSTCFATVAFTASAQPQPYDADPTVSRYAPANPGGRAYAEPGFFSDQEFSFDLFGNISAGEGATRHRFRHGRTGVGIGFNYFAMRYFGVGADAYVGRLDPLPDHLSISGIFRYPINDLNLAPYAFGGVGRQWHPVTQYTAHVGGGLEYRWSRTMGVFGDGRYTFADKTGDWGLFRAGVRFAW